MQGDLPNLQFVICHLQFAKLRRDACQVLTFHKARKLKTIYLYFDNDQAGFAIKNALSLKQLLA